MPKLVTLNDVLQKVGNSAGFVEEFWSYTDTQMWTKTDGDSGASTAVLTTGGSGLVLTTGAVDNNEAYVESTNPVADVLADRPMVAGAIFTFSEANTDDANILFGLTDDTGANSITDNGGGPAGTYEGAVIYKIDGETVWTCESSTGSAQTTNKTTATAGHATSDIHLRIRIEPIDGTTCEITYEYGVGTANAMSLKGFRKDGATPREAVVKHTQSYANMDDMNLMFGVKAGSANSEVVTIRCLYFAQERSIL